MNELLITFTPYFKRTYKRLAKRYVSLDSDMKIRLPIASKNKGKSGGARVITYFVTESNELFLISIYDKSEQESISDRMIQTLIQNMLNEE
ncbi:MAG: hypothetical protein EAZ32_10535 [Cytophagia bacterium]|nr:MAG: hypothetical protein EAZ46_05965 [Runella sp.]TAG20065.1 MAG: hypothetical protein EAZ38_11060 [Cytophagales bacterium]TAG39199.1 MAG: hypothetical protein EAZ32_10535 [Cytophagia bacterium]TAG52212.1 MAG: hypothetical protein EAZ29_08005 [Runella slithyformis]TAG60332.1 MAG: hypothetical protein EAZ26_13990 [Runella slithyformis]